jgi:hypothetical protein
MERIDQAKDGRIMTIKENLHIYIHKKENQLIEAQRANTDDYTNILFDTGMIYMTCPCNPLPRHWIRVYKV